MGSRALTLREIDSLKRSAYEAFANSPLHKRFLEGRDQLLPESTFHRMVDLTVEDDLVRRFLRNLDTHEAALWLQWVAGLDGFLERVPIKDAPSMQQIQKQKRRRRRNEAKSRLVWVAVPEQTKRQIIQDILWSIESEKTR